MKKRAVVICPGRGSYTKETMNYLPQFGRHVQPFLDDLDQRRRDVNQITVSELDQDSTFKPQVHTKGENASPLIYACAYADFMAIDRNKYEIVAVTGNSMGWYLTLMFGGALDWRGGFEVVNTMGSMMKDGIVGGQVIYPICDEQWRKSPEKIAAVEKAVENATRKSGKEIYLSISLGGFVVLGSEQEGVNALLKELPAFENYPFQLINHAAFHTPLLRPIAEKAFSILPESLFNKPKIPLIDGRGCIWQPYSTHFEDLYHYTLGHQVVEPYDFTRAIGVALKEFAPDTLILLGPGSSLGGSVGQILVENNWRGIDSKQKFTELQTTDPILLAMGRSDQRRLVAK
jgi:acyl transferase domain-containing protein